MQGAHFECSVFFYDGTDISGAKDPLRYANHHSLNPEQEMQIMCGSLSEVYKGKEDCKERVK